MRSWFAKAALALLLSTSAAFAQSRVDQLSAGAGVQSTDSIANCQSCGAATALVKTTMAQILTFIQANITSVTGMVKGNGSALVAASAGTDFAAAPTGSANTPLFNNGSGGFTTGSRTGNTTAVVTQSGAATSGMCAQYDASGNLTATAAACGTGSGGGTGFGVDGGTNFTTVTGSGTIGTTPNLVFIGSGWATGTLTLPVISTLNNPNDHVICFDDSKNFIDATHTLTIAANSSPPDTINNAANTGALTTSGGALCVRPNNTTHNWTLEAGATLAASTAPSHQFANSVSLNGLGYAQPAVGDLASVAANTVLGNFTSGSAAPTAQAVSGCSAANDALIWTTNTGFGCNTALISNSGTGQAFTGGLHPTAFSNGTATSGTTTIDCGNGPIQSLTDGGAFTLTMSANDGTCVVRVTNNGSAGTITFSGFSQGSNSGDTLDTTNGHIFDITLTRIGGNPHRLVSALQ